MKLKKLLLLSCNVFGLISFAQVGINTTTPNAQLDIRATSATAPSNTDGLLIPKVNIFPATNPTAAQQGMLLYLTTTSGSNAPGFYYWDNPTATWIGLGKDVKAWQLNGNTVNATTDFMGSTNNADVIFKRNNVRAGRLGVDNTSIGVGALNPLVTGTYNTSIGMYTLSNTTTGSQNTTIGEESLRINTSGNLNTGNGAHALYFNSTGSGNTASGSNSLQSNTTGNYNTGLGYNSQTGANLTNATAIGANASATTSNSLVLGSINGTNGATASTRVGIGTTAPNAALEVKAINPAAPTNTEGLLIPRINVFPATNPTAAQHGMQVFLTTAVGTQQPGFYYWDNPTTSWVGIGGSATGNNWALAGNTVNATTDFMGSTNDADVIFKRNNVRAGRLGANNVSLGVGALNTATTGSWNAAVGGNSLLSNTTGSSNTAVGDDASRGNTTGGFNTAVGSRALRNNATGNDNVGIGYEALESNTAGENVAVGNHTLQNNTTGYQNTALGTNALLSNTTGYENSATGLNALRSNTTGRWLTANGAYALRNNTIGEGNTGIGVTALENNTTGNRNTALGQAALRNNATGNDNTGIGYQALSSNTASGNVAVGTNALQNNTVGNFNTAVGSRALSVNSTGNWNHAFGYEGLEFNTTGVSNISVGGQTMQYNTTGSWGTALGGGALALNTTGNDNTALGFQALAGNTTGSANTALGRWAYQTNLNYSNSTALGANTNITASNQVRLGNNAVSSIGGQVGWTTLSDARFKTENAAKVPGIDFIKKLRPVTYYVDHEAMKAFIEAHHKGSGLRTKDEKNTSMGKSDYKPEYIKTLESGFMAQEVEQAAKELGYEFNGVDVPKSDDDYYGLRYGQFVVPLVKAVQELNEKLDQKQAENDQLRAMLLELEKRIAKLEKNASN
ncbi:tail fiber domain-containing protein [Flavobacterium sp. HXWNR29]|uniref:beta strand repeat-containing protein n=1 Tax=Flavobacterium odoriferum TaxID=2946604 RepID=UPI0021CAE3BC|nr:tail fiber domain-containing protein [Flavobacterium sp. HXWNR29]MCU4188611.1 tail fiber domain-containing protein [Flavobacterium sp. HXWNR29]